MISVSYVIIVKWCLTHMNTWITYKDFEIKNLGKYHDLYLQNDTLLLADIFDNFRNMCLEIYELDPARFPTAPELV